MQRIKISVLFIFISSFLLGQGTRAGLEQGKATAAVLDFEGSGITTQEAQVLTQ
ncbi:MAG: hypothetical protein HOA20_04655, partial [Rhodobacterales bacterium]|nr:hypothetical protein [Rhodobacterales bacterium]